MSSLGPALVLPQMRQEVGERDQQIICTAEQVSILSLFYTQLLCS